MGTVFRAYDPDFQRSLAVKVLGKHHQGRADLEQRFLSEAQLTGQLQHPGVPPVHQIGRLADGRPFFAMKLVSGRTLAELFKDRPNPSVELPRFLAIFAQVCQTVAYAHSRGVIHRDLKPTNIMVGAFGEIQLMDWGLAKVLRQGTAGEASQPPIPANLAQAVADTRHDDLSQIGSVLGTPGYMAPEQARGETGSLDERCDVFSLGALLCEILTGKPPFCRDSRLDLIMRTADGNLGEAFARLDGCGADVELVQVARTCLAARREERPRDGEAVAQLIATYQAGVEERLRRAELELAQAEVRDREERKRRQLVVTNQSLKARDRVKSTAIGLAILAIWNLLGVSAAVALLIILAEGRASNANSNSSKEGDISSSIVLVVILIKEVAVSFLILVGAVKLQKLQSYRWAMTSSILVMIPCLFANCLFGFPLGIWALVTINQADVRKAFRT
jgi:serine/threonine-protein kinase